jgi:hypothetical protein
MAFNYAHGREADLDNADKCVVDRVSQKFDKAGGNIVELAVAIATDDTFVVRR